MKNRRITQIFLFFAMISALTVCFVFGASALEPTGQCGDNVYWSFDESTGELVISGEGDMWDYEGLRESPFSGESNCIKNVVIESGVTSLGNYTFVADFDGLGNLSRLKSVSISDTVISIGTWAFLDCDFLSSITVDKNNPIYSSDELGVLYNKDKTELIKFPCGITVQDFSIPNTVKHIMTEAFEFCKGLRSVNMPNGLESIGSGAFFGCNNLMSISMLDTVKQIGDFAFYGCSNLKSVLMKDSLESIGTSAFSFCKSITEIVIPDSVKSIGSGAFEYCNGLESVVIGTGLANLADGLFYSCGKLSSIIIPDTVKSIDDEVFWGCSSLTNITIPGSVISVGVSSFSECANLTNVSIQNGLITIGSGAFYDCDKLKNFTIPGTVTSIGYGAFKDCSSLTSITVQEGVTNIGESAFYGCYYMTSITLPDSLTSIGDYAFRDCKSLTSITIPDSVISIGKSAFYGCENLTSITIPDSVSSIGNYAFENCYNLTKVNITDLSSWCNISFGGMESNPLCQAQFLYMNNTLMTDIIIPNGVTRIGDWVFENCSSLTSVMIPNSVAEIGVGAFSNCCNLTSITMLDGVKSIGEEAFWGCSNLNRITISNSVEKISEYAFAGGCDSLTDVYYTGTEEQWNAIEIGEANDSLLNATIHFNSIAHTHTPKTITVPATCTVSGMTYTICETCGETIGEPTILPAAHTPGEWETVQEPTITAEGKKVLRCTVCGEIIEEAAIPMLQVVSDKGIDLAFPADNYDGEVDVTVEESFDGTAFDIIDTSANTSQKVIYDIKMILNGEEIQPNSKVTIRIPLPAGYDPTRSFVYHVNTVTGKVEKMDARYEDGYLVFETDHFSYYAVLEIAEANPSDTCTCNCHKGGIVGFFFRMFNFFQKLFGQNKICACGAKH